MFKKLKIVHFLGSQIIPPSPDQAAISGCVNATLQIAQAQAARGHTVFVVTTGQSSWQKMWGAVQLVTLRYQAWARWRGFDLCEHLPFMLWCWRHRPDVLHGQAYFYLRFLRARRRVVHFHGDPFPNAAVARTHTPLAISPADFDTIGRTSDAQIAVSSYVAQQVKRGLNGQANVHIVRNGVDGERFHPNVHSNFREQYAIPASAPLFLFVGALVPAKGIIHLARAFARLAATNPNVHLALAGSSSLWDSATYTHSSTYEAEVRAALPTERVYFLGNVPTGRMAELYTAADVLIIPSVIAEGFPLVAVEGMASGLPIIASSVGGLPDAVDERCAILVEPADEAELLASMDTLIMNHDLRQQLGQSAHEKAQQFTWTQVAEQLETIYYER